MGPAIIDKCDETCRPCLEMEAILLLAAHKLRAFEPWGYDVIRIALHKFDEDNARLS